jgi:Zn-dependent protease with chaperone function
MSDAIATRIRGVIVYSVLKRLRLPVTVVAALAVAEAAVFLMRPRDRVEPVDVAAQTYFSPAYIERAEDFRSGQLLLYGARLVIELGVLIYIVRRPSVRTFRRPILAGAGVGAALAVVITIATLPVAAIARERAKDVGLVTQDWLGWAGDVVKGTAIEALIAAAGGAVLVFAIRRFGRRWWIPASGVVLAFGVITTYATPIVIDPLFNRFDRIEGPLRAKVLELADEAGVHVGEVYEMDASRRTTAANAYVTGLGSTKRVVIYDNLINEFSPEAVEGVVAHELGHVHYDDVPRGLLYLLIVTPFGMLAVARLSERMMRKDAPTPVPAVALAIALIVPAITMISNQLSREVEARADRFSIQLTQDPDGLIEFQRKITVQNVSDPDPPGWVSFLLGTHPTAVQRIGQALAVSQAEEGSSRGRSPGGS